MGFGWLPCIRTLCLVDVVSSVVLAVYGLMRLVACAGV